MADIRLAKPAAGASESVQCAPDARFVFDFPTTDATLAREGDNLNISFQDGSQLQLQGFYQEYNGENLPSFNIDGTEVAAADFFAAMNEPDLMPAAGPGTGTVANGARFHEWGDSSLASGITHLNGLDWGFSRSFEWEDHPNAVGRNGDDWGWWGASGGTVPGGTVPSNEVPDVDVPVPNEPGPGAEGDHFVAARGGTIVVDEGALPGGSGLHTAHGTANTSFFVADVHGEKGGSIELSAGDDLLVLNIPRGSATSITVPGDGPHFHVNGVDITILGATSNGNGKWTVSYKYALTEAVTHDQSANEDEVKLDTEGVSIKVTDGTGDVAHGKLTVEVHDDAPVLENIQITSADADLLDSVETLTGSIGKALEGADAEGATLVVKVGDTTFTGTRVDGEWSFTPSDNAKPGEEFSVSGDTFTYTRPAADRDDNTEDTYKFEFTLTDSDGDSKEETVEATTIVKPGFVPDPDPDDPDAEAPKGQVSSVVTDDSGLTTGTAGADPLAGEKATAEDSFSLTMNGRPITVEIATKDGEGESITLQFNERGELTNLEEGTDHTSLGTATSANGYGHLVVTGTSVADGKITVNYTFTQDKAYQSHGDDTADDELAHNVDSFAVTLTDDLGQADTGVISVSIEDDAPELSLSLRDLGITVGGQATDEVGKLTFDFGADNGEGKSLTVTVDGKETTLKLDAEGHLDGTQEIQGLHGILTIKADGTYTYKANADAEGEDRFQFTITDADGDVVRSDATGANELVIQVGKAPEIKPLLVDEHGRTSESDTSETVIVTMPVGWDADTSKTFTGKHGSISYNSESQH